MNNLLLFCADESSSSSTSTTSSSTTASSTSSTDSHTSCHTAPIPKYIDEVAPDEYPDPELDRSLAIAIATLYTPSPPVRVICTHSLISRERNPHKLCQHCKKTHLFGWVYRCGSCSYRVCHNCRPKFMERSWDSIWGMLSEL